MQQAAGRPVRPARAACCELIEREAENARRGLPARIIAKMNALVDRADHRGALPRLAGGVKIDLIVRGICCLRPGRARA